MIGADAPIYPGQGATVYFRNKYDRASLSFCKCAESPTLSSRLVLGDRKVKEIVANLHEEQGQSRS